MRTQWPFESFHCVVEEPEKRTEARVTRRGFVPADDEAEEEADGDASVPLAGVQSR